MAEGTDIAKAYVQIVPSAKGIKSGIEKELGNGSDVGSSFGSGIASGIKKVIAAAGIGAVIKSAFTEGAAMQQAVGGMETLFKDSASTIIEHANEAYKTAGLSANEYMETATSFAASLLSSLGGDTAQAADAANQAIIDMSDNANKMGTSMESIQNAYKGFAKQNYTMLDNLALGYGGTKEEMERLLADAEKISGVKYDISNLNDVYSAIHVIQTDLGITGTTAAEAAETFSGSFAAMKASASNVLAALTTGGDVSAAFGALSESVQTFVMNNAIPMIGNLISAIPAVISGAGQLFSEMVPELISTITTGITENLPMLAETALQLITGIVSGIQESAPILVEQAAEIIGFLTEGIDEFLPTLLETGVTLLENLIGGMINDIPNLISTATELVNNLLSTVLSHIPEIINTGIQLVMNLVSGLMQNLPQIVYGATQMISTLLITIIEHLPEIIESGINLIAQLVVGLIQAIPQIIMAIPQIIKAIVDTFTEHDWGEIGRNILEGLKNGLLNAVETVKDAVRNVCGKIADTFEGFFGIESPSKWMRDQIGYNLVAGLDAGLNRYKNMAIRTAESVSGSVAEAFNGGINYNASKNATINLNVVGKLDGEPVLRFVNNGLGVAL